MIADFNKQFNHFYGWHSVRSLKVNVQWLFWNWKLLLFIYDIAVKTCSEI
jgi:hypothetical protein